MQAAIENFILFANVLDKNKQVQIFNGTSEETMELPKKEIKENQWVGAGQEHWQNVTNEGGSGNVLPISRRAT
jgi:hypothetical protein